MMKNKDNVGILGYGEVGQAIAKFYKNPKIKDLRRDDGLKGVDVLNVCIPFNKHFKKIVEKEIKEIKPRLVIIHSTVAPGTTKRIGEMSLPKYCQGVVHSPIRGVHPNLFEGVKTFVKYIGADNKKSGALAKKHLEKLGIKTKVFYPSATTEALKVWDTTQYGWMIILNKEIQKWCKNVGLNFEQVYTDANKTYNDGYVKLKKSEVVRPYLRYIPGKIGGHCIIPNAKLLASEISKIILKKNKLY